MISGFILFTCAFNIFGQKTSIDNEKMNQELPYYQIPEYPKGYNARTVAARVLDGLGFRFYWASEGLRPEDLQYKPSAEARSAEETIDHILGLSKVIVNAIKKEPNIRPQKSESLTFEQKRARILNNIKAASDMLKSADDDDLDQYNMVFQNAEGSSEYPFWNLLNGPIADAIWHTGQVVSFRRASGNPFNSKVSVFNGKLRD